MSRIAKPRLAYGLLAVVVLAGAVRSLDARGNWHDKEALWQRAVESNPADGSAWASYAEAVAERDPETARAIVDEGLAHSKHPRLLMRRALLATDHASALALMREAADAGEKRAMSNLALMLLDDKQLDDALAWARKGADSLYEPSQRALGKVELTAKHFGEAEAAFARAYELVQSCSNTYNLALAKLELAKLDDAAALLHRCETDATLGDRVRAALAEIAHRR